MLEILCFKNGKMTLVQNSTKQHDDSVIRGNFQKYVMLLGVVGYLTSSHIQLQRQHVMVQPVLFQVA